MGVLALGSTSRRSVLGLDVGRVDCCGLLVCCPVLSVERLRLPPLPPRPPTVSRPTPDIEGEVCLETAVGSVSGSGVPP